MSKTITPGSSPFLLRYTVLFSQQQVAVNSAPAPEGYGLETEVVAEDIGLLVGALGAVDLDRVQHNPGVYVTMANAWMTSCPPFLVMPQTQRW